MAPQKSPQVPPEPVGQSIDTSGPGVTRATRSDARQLLDDRWADWLILTSADSLEPLRSFGLTPDHWWSLRTAALTPELADALMTVTGERPTLTAQDTDSLIARLRASLRRRPAGPHPATTWTGGSLADSSHFGSTRVLLPDPVSAELAERLREDGHDVIEADLGPGYR